MSNKGSGQGKSSVSNAQPQQGQRSGPTSDDIAKMMDVVRESDHQPNPGARRVRG